MLKKAIDLAQKADICYYDSLAEQNHITIKLLYSIKMNFPTCHYVYASTDCFVEYVPDTWGGPEHPIVLFGIEVHFTKTLDRFANYYIDKEDGFDYMYIKALGLFLPPDKDQLLVCTDFSAGCDPQARFAAC